MFFSTKKNLHKICYSHILPFCPWIAGAEMDEAKDVTERVRVCLARLKPFPRPAEHRNLPNFGLALSATFGPTV